MLQDAEHRTLVNEALCPKEVHARWELPRVHGCCDLLLLEADELCAELLLLFAQHQIAACLVGFLLLQQGVSVLPERGWKAEGSQIQEKACQPYALPRWRLHLGAAPGVCGEGNQCVSISQEVTSSQ